MRLLKFHWVATYGFVPAVIALILAVVLSKGYDRVTYRFLSNSTSPFLISSALSSTIKYCIYAPNLTLGTNLVLQSCNQNSTTELSSAVGIWWNSNSDGLIFSRDDPTLCLSRFNTLLTLDACVSNTTAMLWKWGSDDTITWLYNRAKVITVQPSSAYNGAGIAVLDRIANTLNQIWHLDYFTTVTLSPIFSASKSPTVQKPSSYSHVSPILVSQKPSSRPTWTRRNGPGYVDAFVRTDGINSYDSSTLSFQGSGVYTWMYTYKLYFSVDYRYDSDYCSLHPPSDDPSSASTIRPSRSATSRPRSSRPRNTFQPSGQFNNKYGPYSDDNTYVLIVLHSRNGNRSNGFKYYQYVPKCTSSAGVLSLGFTMKTVNTYAYDLTYNYFAYHSWYPNEFYPCDDDEWLLTMIDCTAISATISSNASTYTTGHSTNSSNSSTSNLLYNCPSNFTDATILAQSNPFKLYGNPYGCNVYENSTTCSSNAVSTARSNTGGQSNGPLVDGSVVSNLAFSSNNPFSSSNNYAVRDMMSQHFKSIFQADIWSWLGNAITISSYYDGGPYLDYNYNAICYFYLNGYNNSYYPQSYNYWFGTKSYDCSNIRISYTTTIPVGTWDDKEYGADTGKNYSCGRSSQDAFVYAYSLPTSDPRHPSQLHQRKGVYSSYMYTTPVGGNGIHLILLDTRTHRSPTRKYGPTACEYATSTMLGDDQWTWLENELNRDSEIKVIGSSIPILPPLYRSDLNSYCSYDGLNGTFDMSNAAVGEGSALNGPSYDIWAEIPQERTKLLQLVQKSINDGHTKRIIFITGNKYSTEFMAKKMPESQEYGPEQVFYEVSTTLSSGSDWVTKTSNSNRLHLTNNMPLSPDDVTYSNQFLCKDGDYFRICSGGLRYGGIRVNWKFRTILLGVFIPSIQIAPAASVFLSF